MKNLSGKPYFEGNPERKTFTLAVVRAVFGQSQCPFYNLITKTQNCSASGRGTRLSQGVCSFHSLLSHRFMQSSLSSPFLLGARHFQVLRGRCTVAWQVEVGVSLGRAVRPTIPLWARDGGYELISSFFREL